MNNIFINADSFKKYVAEHIIQKYNNDSKYIGKDFINNMLEFEDNLFYSDWICLRIMRDYIYKKEYVNNYVPYKGIKDIKEDGSGRVLIITDKLVQSQSQSSQLNNIKYYSSNDIVFTNLHILKRKYKINNLLKD